MNMLRRSIVLVLAALASLLVGGGASAEPTQCPGCTDPSAAGPTGAKALPWRTAAEARQYRVGQLDNAGCSGRSVPLGEFRRDGQRYYVAESRRRWIIWEFTETESQTPYIWYGARTPGDGGVLVVSESGLLRDMVEKYPGPCAWLDATPTPSPPSPVPGFIPPAPEKIGQAPRPKLLDGLLEASQSEGLSACQDRPALLRRIRQRALQIVEGSGVPWEVGDVARLEAALLAAAERGCRDTSPGPIPATST